MTYFDVGQLGRGAAAIGRMVQDYDERIANLEAERDAALVRAERAEAERDALRAQIDAVTTPVTRARLPGATSLRARRTRTAS